MDTSSDLGQPFRAGQKTGLDWGKNRLSLYNIRAEGALGKGQIRSECLTCTFRSSCCSTRLSWAQVHLARVRSECLTCTFRSSCCSTRLSWAQVHLARVRSECLTCKFRSSCCSTRLSWAQVHLARVTKCYFYFLFSVQPAIRPGETTAVLIVDQHDNSQLLCKATGIPHPNITWVRSDGRMLPTGHAQSRVCGHG